MKGLNSKKSVFVAGGYGPASVWTKVIMDDHRKNGLELPLPSVPFVEEEEKEKDRISGTKFVASRG